MMDTRIHTLPSSAPGTVSTWTSLHFGTPGHGPKAVIQCALHADEIPGLLVGVHLRAHLARLEAAGELIGEVVLVPAANVLGGAQALLGSQIGRFDLGTGINFNRGYRYLTPGLLEALKGRLGKDAAGNTEAIRQACRDLLNAWQPNTAADALKRELQLLAVDADTVLDLHCDSQALMHLYAPTPWADTGVALGRCLDARVVLLARESGDDPFDEAVSRHWWELQEALGAQHPIELGCFSTTVELRGEADVTHELAERDALGLLRFLAQRGHLQPSAATPATAGSGVDCVALPLEGVDPLTAPVGGVVVFTRELGEAVEAGAVVAEVIDPLTGEVTPVATRVDGVFFARSKTRWALRGERIGKVAGAKAFRTGKLLSL
jgi:hypothetical protein